jgi:hypothetical protein
LIAPWKGAGKIPRPYQGAIVFCNDPGVAHRFAPLIPGYLPPLFQSEEFFCSLITHEPIYKCS